ncbi:exported hypothetical protein [Desulfamplus magnetovallimortis]|uniref:CHAT domain-containing protein n=1 Tax=Desulfamplus magnetovallimortis TaxID=1246637 RepID=A0A1W1HKN4_9BACT|nr:CHAT domain-containing protein [Desulfamplus magnetovallimortis]SLM32996.1 exported hypothetical protein [Desulfamplus magnetovallimortis]
MICLSKKKSFRKSYYPLTILFLLITILYFFLSAFQDNLFAAYPDKSSIAEQISLLTTMLEKKEFETNIESIQLLVERGEAFRKIGHFDRAKDDFSNALSMAGKMKAQMLEIAAMQSLGYIYYLQNNFDDAERMLGSALDKYERQDYRLQLSPHALSLAASCANRLGNVLAARNNNNQAIIKYKKALNYLEEIKNEMVDSGDNQINNLDFELEAVIQRNIAHVMPDKNSAFIHLSHAVKAVDNLFSPHEQARLLLEIAAEAAIKDSSPSGDAFRYKILERAKKLSEALEPRDLRLISLACGQMGSLYESRSRVADAITLTEDAITAAASIGNHDLMVRWEWQRARLTALSGKRKSAISAYRRALFHMDSIRQNMEPYSEDGCPSDSAGFVSIYKGFADLLLQQSGEEKEHHVQQQLLKEARQSLERGKESELRDYFKDPCINAMTKEIETTSSSNAVIYPVILPDRLEIIADINGNLYRTTTTASQDRVEKTVGQLASSFRNNLFYKNSGQTVYSWLIQPLETLLADNSIDTLVFVPEGIFRTLPLAAIWDGKGFIIERYAVVTEPVLTLFDPKPLPRGNMFALMAGMSEPGPVIMSLPKPLWNTICQTRLDQKNRWIRGLSVKTEELRRDISIAEESNIVDSGNKKGQNIPGTIEGQAIHVKEMLKLPGVDMEMENIASTLKGDVLKNDNFLLENFSAELDQKDFNIIHIASHGFFGGTSDQNFIMTYDKILDINHMEAFIRPRQFAGKPFELITLSACQTAEGDDRSPLGLSGVALKSGARSVLGSLWPVSDIATQELLSTFYHHLKESNITKAHALQQAQMKLIASKEYEHPFFWSAFVLVGNWL